jgi:hypothetical protein
MLESAASEQHRHHHRPPLLSVVPYRAAAGPCPHTVEPAPDSARHCVRALCHRPVCSTQARRSGRRHSSFWTNQVLFGASALRLRFKTHLLLCPFRGCYSHTRSCHPGALFLLWVCVAFIIGFLQSRQRSHGHGLLLESSTWLSCLFLFAGTMGFLYVQVCSRSVMLHIHYYAHFECDTLHPHRLETTP